jgi:hypothetical protein
MDVRTAGSLQNTENKDDGLSRLYGLPTEVKMETLPTAGP